MPRPPREEEAGAIHHVWARGNRRQAIYLDDDDRHRYLHELRQVVARFDWRCLAFCLLGNHLHFIVETPEPTLGKGMQQLHGNYARYFNRRHAASGHTFQGRYGSKRIRTDAQLLVTTRYVARNPVDARICRTPEEWPWGSHALVVGGGERATRRVAPPWLRHDRLLELLSGWGGDPATRYAEVVEAS